MSLQQASLSTPPTHLGAVARVAVPALAARAAVQAGVAAAVAAARDAVAALGRGQLASLDHRS